jgi:hypothetical protein
MNAMISSLILYLSFYNSFHINASALYLMGEMYCNQLNHFGIDELFENSPPNNTIGITIKGAKAEAVCSFSKTADTK